MKVIVMSMLMFCCTVNPFFLQQNFIITDFGIVSDAVKNSCSKK